VVFQWLALREYLVALPLQKAVVDKVTSSKYTNPVHCYSYYTTGIVNNLIEKSLVEDLDKGSYLEGETTNED